jgi:site-specific DNA-cytosine methylase
MNVLELFSGTGSFSKIALEYGLKVYMVDREPKFKPHLIKDINNLKKGDIPFYPDVIWASPPCDQYSHAKRRGERDLGTADANVKKTIEIISWFPRLSVRRKGED